MTLTQKQVKTILESGTYPYTFPIFLQTQKFTRYPSIEVRKVQSDSNLTDVQKTEKSQTFEISFNLKYVRDEESEEADRLAIENEILRVLEVEDIEPSGKIFFESKQWQTSNIDNQIRGSKSTLRFLFKDITSTTGSGIIGAGDIIELNSQTTPVQIQMLGVTIREGATVDTHMDDDGNITYDPRDLRVGEYTISYESTTTLDTLISGLASGRTENNGKVVRGGVTTNYTFLIGQTTKSGQYGDVERATTNFFITGVWV